MVSLNEQSTIDSPPDQVWPLLGDPQVVASCIPGAELTADEDGTWRGTIRVKFGPTTAVFRGEADLTFDDASRRCTIEGRGIDSRGASRALASCVVDVSGDDRTALHVDGEFSVTGPLETFVNAGGVHVARALLTEFSQNIAKVVAERHNPSPARVETQPSHDVAETAPQTGQPEVADDTPREQAPAAALSATALAWRMFKSWLGRLLGRSG